MDTFGGYMLAQSRKETAVERRNYASAALENAQIDERLAEIKSQHEPLNSLIGEAMSERDRLYAAAYYVVRGRMPPRRRQVMLWGKLYRLVMRVAHHYHWHYAPPVYPEGDTMLWCHWCGFRQVVKKGPGPTGEGCSQKEASAAS